MVSGKIQSVGPSESKALIALRKEFLRRNMAISSLMKEFDQMDSELNKLEIENENLTDTII